MSRIRSRNTTPERTVRHALWHRGYRYRLNDRRLPGTPDLVLPKYRTVIFIKSYFWAISTVSIILFGRLIRSSR